MLHRHADPNPPRDSDADVATRRQLAASTCHTCARTATFTRWSSQTRWSSDRLSVSPLTSTTTTEGSSRDGCAGSTHASPARTKRSGRPRLARYPRRRSADSIPAVGGSTSQTWVVRF
ncbi:MAG: hypothetical protein ACJATT_003782 [Myxococcota bacterium]